MPPLVIAACLAGVSGCGTPTLALSRQLDARHLASDLRVQFAVAAEASNRAVMAADEAVSASAVEDARRARDRIDHDLAALRQTLRTLGSSEDASLLDRFSARFDDYRRLDDEILPLAAENTNLKAQRLSFGSARKAADAFGAAIDAAVASTREPDSWHVRALGATALAAVLQIEVLQAPHIAEADDHQMTAIEGQMTLAAERARQALEELHKALPSAGVPLANATRALERFQSINADILRLSRRNSNVRSLALSLGEKRTVTAECEDLLRVLDAAVASRGFAATR